MHQRLLATQANLPALREALGRVTRVALDTEFHPERRYLPQLLLVQLHLDGTTWILDPMVDGLLGEIGEPLLKVTWVVHSGHHDLRLLHDALGALPDKVQDTQIAAGLVRPDFPCGYATLTRELLGVKLEKGATMSDWSRRPLTDEQIRYAAHDVELLFPLWDRLAARLDTLDRTDLAAEACREARDAVADPPADDLLWRTFNGLGHLSPQQAAVAQELLAWREAQARTNDQPPRSVLSDGLVLDLCRRQPTSPRRILDNRRFPRAVAKRSGPELVEVIQRAAARPEWAWPRFVSSGTEQALALEWLRVFSEADGRARSYSARLVLPRERLMDALLHRADGMVPGEAAERALQGWRGALAGPGLAAALSGATSLRLDGLRVASSPG